MGIKRWKTKKCLKVVKIFPFSYKYKNSFWMNFLSPFYDAKTTILAKTEGEPIKKSLFYFYLTSPFGQENPHCVLVIVEFWFKKLISAMQDSYKALFCGRKYQNVWVKCYLIKNNVQCRQKIIWFCRWILSFWRQV